MIIYSRQIPHIHEENVQKHHAVVLEFLMFGCRVTLESLNGKTSFQSHINTIATKWLNHGNWSKLTKPYYLLCEALFVNACK